VASLGYHLLNGHPGVVAQLFLVFRQFVYVSPLERFLRVVVTHILQLQTVVHLSPLELLRGVVVVICQLFSIEREDFQKLFPDFDRLEVSCLNEWPGNMAGSADSIEHISWYAI
jgi:hypothetical protein